MNKAARNPEMGRFNDALRRAVSVSKADLQKLLAEEKMSKISKPKPGPRPKSSASVRASAESD